MIPAKNDPSLHSLSVLLKRARDVFTVMLVLTVALVAWNRFGMQRVVELNTPGVSVNAEDDRIKGGTSVASVERRGADLVLRCRIAAGTEWPYCKFPLNFQVTAAALDLSGFDDMLVDASYRGPGEAKLGLVLLNADEGFTKADRWETFKVNQVDNLVLPADAPLAVPLRWFSVALWWKELARPPMEHSFVRIDNIVSAAVLTSIDIGPGEHEFVLRSLRARGKWISPELLLFGLVTAWILFAIACLGSIAVLQRAQLRASDSERSLLAQVNKALVLEARELAGQAHSDPLTGVLNRQGMRAALMGNQAMLAEPMSVVFVDVDHFKSINDTHGHAVGDAVLVALAKLLSGSVRSSDRVIRWGGEEFLLVCPMTDARQAVHLAESLRSTMHAHDWPCGLRVTASFGVAKHDGSHDIGAVIASVDAQLYVAKNNGRDRVSVADAADA